ncbi:MAG: patatin-like phospholipase family protein, partial [Clostridiaceae bacterium]
MKEYGLVLAGGGAKGGYEIGVYKSLIKNNINIKAVAGASVGALNGAMIVQGDYEKAAELWKNINVQNVINLEKLRV